MDTNTNRAKSAQLGMPFGTASHQLRKQILFHLLQRLNEDVCYRCQEKIATHEELSIEHKQPWLNIDPALFWDLDNIAFSHLSCNSRAANRSPSRGDLLIRLNAPAGQSWCWNCKKYLPMEAFSLKSSAWNKVNPQCKSCVAIERKRRRQNKTLIISRDRDMG